MTSHCGAIRIAVKTQRARLRVTRDWAVGLLGLTLCGRRCRSVSDFLDQILGVLTRLDNDPGDLTYQREGAAHDSTSNLSQAVTNSRHPGSPRRIPNQASRTIHHTWDSRTEAGSYTSGAGRDSNLSSGYLGLTRFGTASEPTTISHVLPHHLPLVVVSV